jgi:hypothetical protein
MTLSPAQAQAPDPVVSTVRSNGLIYDSCKTGMAIFSPDRSHRYFLSRPLDHGHEHESRRGPVLCFCMQNPSKAGAQETDPTIERCLAIARRPDIGARLMCVVNMGAGIATDPKQFLKLADPIGPENLHQIEEAVALADIVIAAWGALDRARQKLFGPSIDALKSALLHGKVVRCLGKTKSGDPRHPLYLKTLTPLVNWP